MEKAKVGKRIKELRMRKGLTQAHFGQMIDEATKSMVSKWERGETSPSSRRQKILIEMGKSEGIDLYPTEDADELKSFIIIKEYRNFYDKYLSLHLKESGKRFERLLNAIDEDTFMNDIVDEALEHFSDQELDSNELKNILYDAINQKFIRMRNEYPEDDHEVVNQIINQIMQIEDALYSYYYDDDGKSYQINSLTDEGYKHIDSVLEFAKFQLKSMTNK